MMKIQGRLVTICMAVGRLLVDEAGSARDAWSLPTVRDLSDQIHALCGHMASFSSKTDDDLTRCLLRLRLERARFLDDLGDLPAQAVGDGLRLLEDAEENLGDGDPITLTCRHNLAIAYQQAGMDDKAIAEYEKNLADRIRILGADHADTLASRNNLATAYQDIGHIEEAIKEYEKNLADRARILGADHPDTLASRNNLATAYQDAGRPWQAITLYERNLGVKPLGSAHDHANILRLQISPRLPLHERTRADGKRTIRAGHPDFLGYQNNLATAYLELGHIREATEWMKRTLEEKVDALGKYHPSTIVSENNLAIAYLEAGRVRQATLLLEAAQVHSISILGKSHRFSQTIGENLATARSAKAILCRLTSIHRARRIT